ncbi:MAG TPA: ribonuclease P protein component [Terriglobales bacterium]|nr:ribonuclease P protein component [Terriglobales bacterium]
MSVPRDHRLRKHSDFELVYASGKRHFSSLLTAFYLPRVGRPDTDVADSPASGARVGFTVGRQMGKAVARNRIKRRLREAVGKNLHVLEVPVDVVINPKKSAKEVDFQVLCAEVERAFAAITGKLSACGAGKQAAAPGSK